MALVTKSAVSQKAGFAGRVAPVRPQVDIRQLYVAAWTLQRFLRDTACCHRRPQGACASVQQPAPGPPGSQETPSPLTWTQSEWPSPQIASNHCSRLGWSRRHRSWPADLAEALCGPHNSWSDPTLSTGCCQRAARHQTCAPNPSKAHTPAVDCCWVAECRRRTVCVCSEAKNLAGNYGFDPLYLAAKDEETFKW